MSSNPTGAATEARILLAVLAEALVAHLVWRRRAVVRTSGVGTRWSWPQNKVSFHAREFFRDALVALDGRILAAEQTVQHRLGILGGSSSK